MADYHRGVVAGLGTVAKSALLAQPEARRGKPDPGLATSLLCLPMGLNRTCKLQASATEPRSLGWTKLFLVLGQSRIKFRAVFGLP